MTNPTSKSLVDLNKMFTGVQLPALPQSAIRLLELSKDSENGPAEFAVPIEADPGLTSQVLRFVNSSYFGFSREISTVKLAITLVGIRTIKNFALWSAVFSLMPNPRCGSLDLKNLWQDSLRRGLFARTFGKLRGLKDAEEAFAAALLQDMAVPLLARELPNEYAQIIDGRANGQARMSDLEREKFGWTHADAGATIGETWHLPEELIDLIKGHTDLDRLAEDSDASHGALAVALSALLPASIDDVWHESARFEENYKKLAGAAAPEIAEFLAQVDADFEEFSPVLNITVPSKTLGEFYQEATAAAAT